MSQEYKPFQEVNPGKRLPQLETEILEFWKNPLPLSPPSSTTLEPRKAPNIFFTRVLLPNGKPGSTTSKPGLQRSPTKPCRLSRAPQSRLGLSRSARRDRSRERLGFSGKKAIEDYGVEPFNRNCRASVMEYEQPWREMTERIGYWCDLDNAYMTMSNDFVESVWWSLKELWNKELLYLGYKVVPYCAKDGTPLSSHEVGLGYKDVRDPSIYVRFPLRQSAKRLGLRPGPDVCWSGRPLPGLCRATWPPPCTADLDYVAVVAMESRCICWQKRWF